MASSPKLLFWMAGLSFQDLGTKFWRRRRVQHSESDVILRSGYVCEASCFSSHNWLGSCQRTKRWMSDASFQPKIFWYLPASVANEISLKPPPPGVSVLNRKSQAQNKKSAPEMTCLLPVYVGPAPNINSDENNKLRKYASILRRDLNSISIMCHQVTKKSIEPLRPTTFRHALSC